MPFPDGEKLRAAVEQSIHDGLEAGGSWFAEGPEVGEVEFEPAGSFGVTVCLNDDEVPEDHPEDAPIERTYRFRVKVELVEVVDGAV